MPPGPIYAERVFVYDLDAMGPFYDALGYETVHTSDDFRIDRTGSADLIIEQVDPSDSENASLVGRFVSASFAVGDIGHARPHQPPRREYFHAGRGAQRLRSHSACQFQAIGFVAARPQGRPDRRGAGHVIRRHRRIRRFVPESP